MIGFIFVFVDFCFIDWEYDILKKEEAVWDVPFSQETAKNRVVSLNMLNSNPNMVVWNWCHWETMGTLLLGNMEIFLGQIWAVYRQLGGKAAYHWTVIKQYKTEQVPQVHVIQGTDNVLLVHYGISLYIVTLS